jgi:Leucine-rich repeat (LRR) protein
LKNLSFNNSKLELIDITKNIALERLDCSYNKLTNINLLKNINLEYLYCNDNQITNLDILPTHYLVLNDKTLPNAGYVDIDDIDITVYIFSYTTGNNMI